ncbi:MAG: hypothetical protein KAJ15_06270, partial [Spirochaetes bacterium]|nr:hypothetical protein [Spirochaetota bacterium]
IIVRGILKHYETLFFTYGFYLHYLYVNCNKFRYKIPAFSGTKYQLLMDITITGKTPKGKNYSSETIIRTGKSKTHNQGG